jgi:hypothetical protein
MGDLAKMEMPRPRPTAPMAFKTENFKEKRLV